MVESAVRAWGLPGWAPGWSESEGEGYGARAVGAELSVGEAVRGRSKSAGRASSVSVWSTGLSVSAGCEEEDYGTGTGGADLCAGEAVPAVRGEG